MTMYRIVGRDFGEPTLPDAMLAGLTYGDTADLTLDPAVEAVLIDAGLIELVVSSALQVGLDGKVDNSEVGAADGVASLGSDGKVPSSQLPDSAGFVKSDRYSVPGVNSVGAGSASLDMRASVIESVQSSLGVTPSSSHVIDIHKNGSTIFTTQANRPTIEGGERSSGLVVPDVTSIGDDDYLTLDIDTVGLGAAAVPTYVTHTAHSFVGGPTTTYDISRHASTETGDLLYVSLISGGAVTWSADDFEQIGTHGVVEAGPGVRVSRFWRIDDGTAGPFVFTASGSAGSIFAQSMIYRGAHATAPIESVTQVDHGAVTDYVLDDTHTTVNDGARVLVEVVPSAYAGVPAGVPAGHTLRAGFSAAAAVWHQADILMPTAGALGALTVTLGAAQSGSSARIGIRPGAGVSAVPGSDLTVTVRYTES